jgi:hypothetical protein
VRNYCSIDVHVPNVSKEEQQEEEQQQEEEEEQQQEEEEEEEERKRRRRKRRRKRVPTLTQQGVRQRQDGGGLSDPGRACEDQVRHVARLRHSAQPLHRLQVVERYQVCVCGRYKLNLCTTCESHNFETSFSRLVVSMVEAGCSHAMGQVHSTCTAPVPCCRRSPRSSSAGTSPPTASSRCPSSLPSLSFLKIRCTGAHLASPFFFGFVSRGSLSLST